MPLSAVGGDIGRVDDPEWRVQCQAAGKWLAAFALMARDAVARRHQILAAAKLRRIRQGIIEGLSQQAPRGDGGTRMGRQRQHLAHGKAGDTQNRCTETGQ